MSELVGIVEDLKDLRRQASADVAESKSSPNSYGTGYDQGWLAAVEAIQSMIDVALEQSSPPG